MRRKHFWLTIALIILVVAIAGVIAVAAQNSNRNTQNPEVNDPVYPAMQNPAELENQLVAAQQLLPYQIKVSGIKVKDESLSQVLNGVSSIRDDSTTLYLTYGQGIDQLYALTQTQNSLVVPDGAEQLELFFGNKKTTLFIHDKYVAAEDEALVSNQTVFWEDNGIKYELSEFGTLSRDELFAIIKNLRTL